jgi:N-acetylglucosaminyldiphosphoundecaprenol N-acetyl-beta-D-mannosaminyltransferase
MEDDLSLPAPVWVLGLPITPLTRRETGEAIVRIIRAGRPSYFITANLNYAMLTERMPKLVEINARAALITADGMPLVKAARRAGAVIPERVAGSDLIYDLAALAAEHGFRIFLLGAPPGVAQEAADRLLRRYPGLVVCGVASPPYRELSKDELDELLDTIRASKPDLLLVAFGQPKGELWIARHLASLGVPLSVNLGASLDFVAGRISRAPRWLQRIGLEWLFRLALEPKRLFTRYFSNGLFYIQMSMRGPRHWERKSTLAEHSESHPLTQSAAPLELASRGDRDP